MGTFFGTSWKTTLMGYLVAAVLYAHEAMNAGTVLPKDSHGWVTFVIAAALAIWGRVQKDATVSNSPSPGPATPVPTAPVP